MASFHGKLDDESAMDQLNKSTGLDNTKWPLNWSARCPPMSSTRLWTTTKKNSQKNKPKETNWCIEFARQLVTECFCDSVSDATQYSSDVARGKWEAHELNVSCYDVLCVWLTRNKRATPSDFFQLVRQHLLRVDWSLANSTLKSSGTSLMIDDGFWVQTFDRYRKKSDPVWSGLIRRLPSDPPAANVLKLFHFFFVCLFLFLFFGCLFIYFWGAMSGEFGRGRISMGIGTHPDASARASGAVQLSRASTLENWNGSVDHFRWAMNNDNRTRTVHSDNNKFM